MLKIFIIFLLISYHIDTCKSDSKNFKFLHWDDNVEKGSNILIYHHKSANNIFFF